MGLFSQRSCPMPIVRAFRDGEYTDLTITSGESTFEVHQVVVCTTCDFFKQGMRFGKEAEEKRINLPEDDPEMIRRLISYLYLGDYDPCYETSLSLFNDVLKRHPSTSPVASAHHSRYRKEGLFGGVDLCACLTLNTENVKQLVLDLPAKSRPSDFAMIEKPSFGLELANPLTIHATMYSLADKYQVDGLGKLAKEKFESTLHHHTHSEDFVSAIQIAYSSTPDSNRGLRDTIVKAFLVHFKVNIADIPGAEEKLDRVDELSFLMIKSWPVKTEPSKTAASAFSMPEKASNTPTGSPVRSSQPAAQATPNLFGGVPSGGAARPVPLSGSIFGGAPATASQRIGSSFSFGSPAR